MLLLTFLVKREESARINKAVDSALERMSKNTYSNNEKKKQSEPVRKSPGQPREQVRVPPGEPVRKTRRPHGQTDRQRQNQYEQSSAEVIRKIKLVSI